MGSGRLIDRVRAAARLALPILGLTSAAYQIAGETPDLRAATDCGISTRAQRGYPPDMAGAGPALARTSRYRRAVVQELIGFASSIAGGALPLTVLTAGPDLRAHWYPIWRPMRDELAALSSRSVHLIAEHSGHHTQLDDPAFVVEAIRDAAQRTSTRPPSRSTP